MRDPASPNQHVTSVRGEVTVRCCRRVRRELATMASFNASASGFTPAPSFTPGAASWSPPHSGNDGFGSAEPAPAPMPSSEEDEEQLPAQSRLARWGAPAKTKSPAEPGSPPRNAAPPRSHAAPQARPPVQYGQMAAAGGQFRPPSSFRDVYSARRLPPTLFRLRRAARIQRCAGPCAR